MERHQIQAAWRDDTINPSSQFVRDAFVKLTGADPQLVEEWGDLEGHCDIDSKWVTYEDFLMRYVMHFRDTEAEEHMSPADWAAYHHRLGDIWTELATTAAYMMFDEQGNIYPVLHPEQLDGPEQEHASEALLNAVILAGEAASEAYHDNRQ